MDNIEIIDNFLDHEELILLNKYLNMNQRHWYYGHSSGYHEQIVSKFFASHNIDLNKEDFFYYYILKKIENYFSNKYKINRHYMHIQLFGQDGGFHDDDKAPNTYTFCIYVTNCKNEELENYGGGEFLIKIPKENFILSIPTFMNRAILFPSTFLHKGMAYNIHSENPRLCITWKLEKIN